MNKKYVIKFEYGGNGCSYPMYSTNDYSEHTRANEGFLMDMVNYLIDLHGISRDYSMAYNVQIFDDKGKLLFGLDKVLITPKQ